MSILAAEMPLASKMSEMFLGNCRFLKSNVATKMSATVKIAMTSVATGVSRKRKNAATIVNIDATFSNGMRAESFSSL